jgi:hypothetical protein
MTPRTKKEVENPLFPFDPADYPPPEDSDDGLPDNVIADSKPAAPIPPEIDTFNVMTQTFNLNAEDGDQGINGNFIF